MPLPFQGKEGRKKPVLIRADQTQPVEEGPVTPDPKQAREHVEIGDFYFKRENYKAAEERYRDAIRYHTKWSEPYEKLIRALEKQDAHHDAVKICEQFITSNPSSEEIERFKKWAEELRQKTSGG